jgi:hypothetical protein
VPSAAPTALERVMNVQAIDAANMTAAERRRAAGEAADDKEDEARAGEKFEVEKRPDGAERAAEAPSLGGGLASTLDVASGGKARMAYNPAASLANFIHQSGGGGGRIMRTSTTHGILGGTNDGPSASGSSGSDDVAAAIRATAGLGM